MLTNAADVPAMPDCVSSTALVSARRRVAHETWHPAQQGRRLADGRYELRLPYADATELVMDVLRFAGQVEVIGDERLKQGFAERIGQAARRIAA